MTGIVKSAAVVLAALWVGIPFCIGFVVAPYLFSLAARQSEVVPHTGAAATLIGPLLQVAEFVSLAGAIVIIAAILFLRWRGEIALAGKWYVAEAAAAVTALSAATNYWVISPQITELRAQIAERYGAFHLADKADAMYQQFGTLHQASTAVFVVGLVAAVVCLVCMTQFRRKQELPH